MLVVGNSVKFRFNLNRPNPEQVTDVISHMEVIEDIPSGPITKTEISSAILSMSIGKEPGIEDKTVELLKADKKNWQGDYSDVYCCKSDE